MINIEHVEVTLNAVFMDQITKKDEHGKDQQAKCGWRSTTTNRNLETNTQI